MINIKRVFQFTRRKEQRGDLVLFGWTSRLRADFQILDCQTRRRVIEAINFLCLKEPR